MEPGLTPTTVIGSSQGEPASYHKKDGVPLHSDVSRCKGAAHESAPREQELRSIVANTPDIIARFDRDLRHVFISQAIERETGVPPRRLRRPDHHGWVGPRSRPGITRTALRRVLSTGDEE